MWKTHAGSGDALLGTGSFHRPGPSGRGEAHSLFLHVPGASLIAMGCISLLDSFGHSFGCAGGPSQRGFGGCGRSGLFLCLQSALLAPGSQRAQFLGGRGGLWQGSRLWGCFFLLHGGDGRAAIPSHGCPRQRGEVCEGGPRLHPQLVLQQGCLLPVPPEPAHFLLQLLEEACEGRDGGRRIELRAWQKRTLPYHPLEGRRQGWEGLFWPWDHLPRHHCPSELLPDPTGQLHTLESRGHLVLSRMGLSALGTPHPHHSRLRPPRPRSSALPLAARPGLGAVAGLLSTASCGAERAEVTQEGTPGVAGRMCRHKPQQPHREGWCA